MFLFLLLFLIVFSLPNCHVVGVVAAFAVAFTVVVDVVATIATVFVSLTSTKTFEKLRKAQNREKRRSNLHNVCYVEVQCYSISSSNCCY